jgi:hypothetical protein
MNEAFWRVLSALALFNAITATNTIWRVFACACVVYFLFAADRERTRNEKMTEIRGLFEKYHQSVTRVINHFTGKS